VNNTIKKKTAYLSLPDNVSLSGFMTGQEKIPMTVRK
jgi:hypothetical protein